MKDRGRRRKLRHPIRSFNSIDRGAHGFRADWLPTVGFDPKPVPGPISFAARIASRRSRTYLSSSGIWTPAGIQDEFGWKAITGQIDIDTEWDGYVKAMMKAGLETLLEALGSQKQSSSKLHDKVWPTRGPPFFFRRMAE